MIIFKLQSCAEFDFWHCHPAGRVGVYSQTPSVVPLTTALASARGVGTLATLARASGFLQILAEDTAFTGTLFLPNDLVGTCMCTAHTAVCGCPDLAS